MIFPKNHHRSSALILAGILWVGVGGVAAESPPARLLGSWRISRILASSSTSCWSAEQAKQLLGTNLTYRSRSMRWHGGEVPLQGVVTREVTAEEFLKESSDDVELARLGIRSNSVTEIDLQHEDAYITGATTEVPGDSVLLAGPNRIVVSACRVFYEATRLPAR